MHWGREYDNLKAAVSKILVGSERELAARFLALANHHTFEACSARPRGARQGRREVARQGKPLAGAGAIPSGRALGEISTRYSRASTRA